MFFLYIFVSVVTSLDRYLQTYDLSHLGVFQQLKGPGRGPSSAPESTLPHTTTTTTTTETKATTTIAPTKSSTSETTQKQNAQSQKQSAATTTQSTNSNVVSAGYEKCFIVFADRYRSRIFDFSLLMCLVLKIIRETIAADIDSILKICRVMSYVLDITIHMSLLLLGVTDR